MVEPLKLAISKGRIFDEMLLLLATIDIYPIDDPKTSRKLVLDTNRSDLKLIIIRAADVPTYVEYGAADLGVAGKDVLLEHLGNGLYEPLDLQIARCRMVVAGKPQIPAKSRHLRIATKYVHSARRFYAEQGEQVEVIKLYGSMELAPLVGLADRIVDLVDTGNTLKANGLVLLAHIADISSRLVVNKAVMKIEYQRIKEFIHLIARAVERQNG
ncbi:ATP phosphoribosyltransferase [Candidatus Nitrosoglobus terrae]|uniref:ATP phosphoribosyltransferase n=1 Tax=Candidatus Nitrosoglobus terrae TaxID=1630141 RepID=A0A1Q2SPA8_9GAMM|nr:ATP phosphoribosyltransferase [Candidatus Nitrosoglobus terrae]BAW80978.1 ATP phosphoribosyltransferase [Candidatus Nitrosoglobus terrae]